MGYVLDGCLPEARLLNHPSAEAAQRTSQGFPKHQQGSELTPGIFSLHFTDFYVVGFFFFPFCKPVPKISLPNLTPLPEQEVFLF